MPLGPDIPAWAGLQRELERLGKEIRAYNVYVLDARTNVWCAAHSAAFAVQAQEIVAEVLAHVRPPLHRGGRLDLSSNVAHGHSYLRSFAGIYVLLVRFSSDFDLRDVRARVGAAMPRIEALTLALPPPDGPGNGTAEGVGVA